MNSMKWYHSLLKNKCFNQLGFTSLINCHIYLSHISLHGNKTLRHATDICPFKIMYHFLWRTADLSDTFSVRKMQLLGGQRPPQDLLASQKLAHVPWGSLWQLKRSWGGLWPPKRYIFLAENVFDKSRKICCMARGDAGTLLLSGGIFNPFSARKIMQTS